MKRTGNVNGRRRLSRAPRGTLFIGLLLGACVAVVAAQTGARTNVEPSVAQRSATDADDALARAADAVCAERELDPRASVPIDVMQARANLPSRSAEAQAGMAHALQLLPVAKQLAAESLTELMRASGVAESARRAALARISAVERIKLEVPLRDNASIVYGDARAIRFGTIFVASLPSDEGMVSVMAHELTHAADGARGTLAPVFRRVARRAEASTGLGHISGRRGEELTCDLVGVMSARLFVARNATDEPRARRAARALEHNCVEHDETDAEHLSPRQTLRAVLALTPALVAEVTGEANDLSATNALLNHSATTTRRDANQRRARVAKPRDARIPPRHNSSQ